LCKKIPKSHLTRSLGFSLHFIDGQTLRIGRSNAKRTTPLPTALDCRGIGRLLCRDGQCRAKLAYVYFEDEPGRRSAAKLLSKDEA
jgi:hypothetical protein